MKDIEYERNGVKKLAQERFKDALIAEGWRVVADEKPAKVEKKPFKKKDK